MKENINKYYIPEYSDIYIGQDLYTINGYKIDLSTVDSLTAFLQYQNFYKDCEGNITYGINLENYRLKYLDHIDIEELGFTYGEVPSSYGGEGGYIKNIYNETIYLHFEENIRITNNFTTLFKGKVKNKSELKKVLNMLNIK